MIELKIARKKSLKDTLVFNLTLSLILVLTPYILFSILLRAFRTQDIPFIFVLVLLTVLLSYLEFVTRQKPILNKFVYALYWILIIFAIIFSAFFVLLLIVSVLFPLKWG